MTSSQLRSLVRAAVDGAAHPSPSVAMVRCPNPSCRQWIEGRRVHHPSGGGFTADRALAAELTAHLETCGVA